MNFDEIYQDIILDHCRAPRNFGPMDDADITTEGENPTCGDEIKLQLKVRADEIEDARFTGQGCAICMASASLMTRTVKKHSTTFAQKVFEQFHGAIGGQTENLDALGDLAALAGVQQFPQRVKCAMLPWETLRVALTQHASIAVDHSLNHDFSNRGK
ncbi:MAG: Fe-S cluster assembly sulfur transfer protein SufU [Chthoniobacterales bacterium]